MSWFLSFFFLLSGCGYTLSHRLNPSFEKVREGIFVPVFSNNTDEFGAEMVLTNALIRNLESRGGLKVVSKDRALAELWGTVTGINYGPSAFTDPGFGGLAGFRRMPAEYVVTVYVSLSLVDSKTRKVLWGGNFNGTQRVAAPFTRTFDYQAPSSIGLFTDSLIFASYSDIARNIMQDVYDDMVSE